MITYKLFPTDYRDAKFGKSDFSKTLKIKRFEILGIKFQTSFCLKFHHFQDNFKTKEKLSQTSNFCLGNVYY